jgi:hypothetical protein
MLERPSARTATARRMHVPQHGCNATHRLLGGLPGTRLSQACPLPMAPRQLQPSQHPTPLTRQQSRPHPLLEEPCAHLSPHSTWKVQAREGRCVLECRSKFPDLGKPRSSSQSSSSPFSSRPPIHGLCAPPLEPSKVVWPRALHHPRTTFWRWRVVII